MPSHLKEKVYLACPVWIQNILVSFYGAMEHRRRYGGIYSTTKSELEATEFLDRAAIEQLVQKRLHNILEGALESVPHYRKLQIDEPSLDQFPLLERHVIAEDTDQFLSERYNQKDLLTIYTGGSTGTALKIHLSKSVRQQTYAFWARFYRNFDFTIGEKKASFVGRKVQDPDKNKPPFWRYNWIDQQLVFSSFHMTEENLPAYIRELNQFKPKLIEGYPLSLLRLADYILSHEIPLSFQPVGLSTSSENFTSEQRRTMETAFNCKVYDQYGSAESVIFAAECSHGNMHVAPEYGVLEVLNDDGELGQEGEGEFIVTTLLNDVMPLIRYKIGDLGKVAYKTCPCGRQTQVIEELFGKTGAVIVSEGRRVPTAAIAIAFEYLENIKKAQIIQNEPGKVIVKLVTTDRFTKKDEDFMRWELEKMLGNKLNIETKYVNNIPPSINGKYHMVVQNYFK